MLNFYFVCDNRIVPLYDGKVKPMNWDGAAQDRFKETRWLDMYDFTFEVLWRERNLKIPIVDGWRIVTSEFIDFITENSQNDRLRDSVFQIWKRILEDFNVVVADLKDWPTTAFMKKWAVKKIDNSYVLTEAKEMMDWYINLKWVNWVKFCEDPKDVMYEWVNFHIEWQYAPMLRELSFIWWDFFEMTAKKYWLANAKYLQDFQMDVLKNMGKYTFFTVIRQVGKTLLLSWIALRELMRDRPKWKKTLVIYISNELDDRDQVKDYMEQLSEEFNERFWSSWGKFEISWKSVKFTNGKKSKASGKKVLWEVRYFSSQGRNPGTGKSGDLIIWDEINLRPEKVWKRNSKVVENKLHTRFIGATTMYTESDPNHWSNKMLKKWEAAVMKRWPINDRIIKTYKQFFMGKDLSKIDRDVFAKVWRSNYYVWLRYSWEDVEIMTDRQKEQKKKSYEWDEDAFLVERCGVYPDDVKVFTFDHVIREMPQEYTDSYIIWYDPSAAKKKWDDWWFLVSYVKDWVLKVCDTPILLQWDFDYQCDQVIKFISELDVSFMLIIDTSWFGGAIVWQRFDRLSLDHPEVLPPENYLKLSTSWWNKTNRIEDLHYSSPLKIQVWFLKNALYNERVIFSHVLEKLFSQMRKYKRKKTATWETTWNGWRGDDYVSALLLVVWYFYEILGMKEDAFDKQAMTMISRREKTEEEISNEIEAKKLKEQRTKMNIANRAYSRDIY